MYRKTTFVCTMNVLVFGMYGKLILIPLGFHLDGINYFLPVTFFFFHNFDTEPSRIIIIFLIPFQDLPPCTVTPPPREDQLYVSLSHTLCFPEKNSRGAATNVNFYFLLL